MNPVAVSRLVSVMSWTESSGIPHFFSPSRIQETMARLEFMASLPPLKITAFPVLKHRAKASAVTLGLAS